MRTSATPRVSPGCSKLTHTRTSGTFITTMGSSLIRFISVGHLPLVSMRGAFNFLEQHTNTNYNNRRVNFSLMLVLILKSREQVLGCIISNPSQMLTPVMSLTHTHTYISNPSQMLTPVMSLTHTHTQKQLQSSASERFLEFVESCAMPLGQPCY